VTVVPLRADQPHHRLKSRLRGDRPERRILIHLREFHGAVLIRAFERRACRLFLTQRIVNFAVTNLALEGFVFTPADNHDPEGDSNGTTIVVTRP
jgi:hypothetical protein